MWFWMEEKVVEAAKAMSLMQRFGLPDHAIPGARLCKIVHKSTRHLRAEGAIIFANSFTSSRTS
jgi:hypothetical protein